MYSNIQSYHKKLTTKLWKSQDTKRRSSNPNLKKDNVDSSDHKSTINYDVQELKYFIEQNVLVINKLPISLSMPLLEFQSKLRPIRTRKFQNNNLDLIDKINSPRLESYLQSYNKDFIYFKSKYQDCNRQHLIFNLPNSDFPLYEIDQEFKEISSADEMMKLWQDNQYSKAGVSSTDSISPLNQPKQSGNNSSDPFIIGLLVCCSTSTTASRSSVAVASIDVEDNQRSQLRQRNQQQKLFPLYGPQPMASQIELKHPALIPHELVGLSFLVKLSVLRLMPVQLEPIFAELCLYDVQRRCKISENFYCSSGLGDSTSSSSKSVSSCIFHVSHASDIYLVIRIEKTAQQGDVNEVADLYLKEDKHKTTKLRQQIEWSSRHLAKYRMPFGIIALQLNKLMNSTNSNNSGTTGNSAGGGVVAVVANSDSASVSSARFSSTSTIRSNNSSTKMSSTQSSTVVASSRKSQSNVAVASTTSQSQIHPGKDFSKAQQMQFQKTYNNMLLSETVINHFYRLDTDRISDEDLYKWLLHTQDSALANPSSSSTTSTSATKNPSSSGGNSSLPNIGKTIPCSIELQVSPINELTSQLPILTPEHHQLTNQLSDLPIESLIGQSCTTPPIIDLLELRPATTITSTPTSLAPHCLYRNLLYVYPKSVNMSGKSSNNYRNISIKIELQHSDGQRIKSIKLIYNRRYYPKFVGEAYTKMLYHNKNPNFNDEIKIQLPAIVTREYFLMFTFYHLSCQINKSSKSETGSAEQIIGYSWLPLMSGHLLRRDEQSLMIAVDKPNPAQVLKKPDIQTYIDSIRWLDHSKDLFRVALVPVSSVHSNDTSIEQLIECVSQLRQQSSANSPTIHPDEASLIDNLVGVLDKLILSGYNHSVVEHCFVIFDNLLWTIMYLQCFNSNTATARQSTATCTSRQIVIHKCIYAMANIIQNITAQHQSSSSSSSSSASSSSYKCNLQNRQEYLISYVEYAAYIPNYLNCDEQLMKQYISYKSKSEAQRNVTAPTEAYLTSTVSEENLLVNKLFHEQLLLYLCQCLEKSADLNSNEYLLANLWFFLELLLRSMREFQYSVRSATTHPIQNVFTERYIANMMRLIYLCLAYIDRCVVCNQSTTTTAASAAGQYAMRNLALFCCDLAPLLQINDVRHIFINIIIYINSRIEEAVDASEVVKSYVILKLELLRILSSCENFLYLNALDIAGLGSSVDPIGEGEESPLFIGLILREVKLCLACNDAQVQSCMANLMWNLLASHESDTRYSPTHLPNLARIYLGYLAVLFDSISGYFKPRHSSRHSLSSGSRNINLHQDSSSSIISLDAQSATQDQSSAAFNTTTASQHCLMQLDTEQLLSNIMCSAGGDDLDQCSSYSEIATDSRLPGGPPGDMVLPSDVVIHQPLLLSMIWILKNLPASQLEQYLHSLTPYRVNRLLYLLVLALIHFEYKAECKTTAPSQVNPTSSRSSLVDPASDGQLINRKLSQANSTGNPHYGKLCTEVSFVVLDTLAAVLKWCERSNQSSAVSSAYSTNIITNIMKITIKALSLNQSVPVIQSLLAFQRLLVKKYYRLMIDEVYDLLSQLCECLLALSGSQLKEIRSHSVASLFLIMKYNYNHEKNFSRVKLQITMALHRLVCSHTTGAHQQQNFHGFNANDISLQLNLSRSLQKLCSYAQINQQLELQHHQEKYQETQFCSQVVQLADNLGAILTDTVTLQRLQLDNQSDLQLELMSRIAQGYSHCPDLRLAWLQIMAQTNVHCRQELEAGMCMAHAAALVAEYLALRQPYTYLPRGAVDLAEALDSPNILRDESATSDDTIAPGEDGVCNGEDFTQTGLVRLVRLACRHFTRAQAHELVPRLISTITSIPARNRDYQALYKLHELCAESYRQISGPDLRHYPSYFRVGFYGSNFDMLDSREFIVKQPPFTKLNEIAHQLESFYQSKFGTVEILKDSNEVSKTDLNPNKMYIQITFVEPYFETTELARRPTLFERNFNLRKFSYNTPYTQDGKAHSDNISQQYKRRTILYTQYSMPYIKSRLDVTGKSHQELCPIEVALDDINKKIDQLTIALAQQPIDIKYLQMMLQGAIGTTVNQGPVEMANAFLSPADSRSSVHIHRLKLAFKEFLRKCGQALECNESFVGPDQYEYQRELTKNYHQITEKIHPLLYYT